MSLLKQDRRLRGDDRARVLEAVAVATSGEDPRPWPDFARLSDDEALELVERTERIQAGEIDRDDAKFWRLVAKASGFAPDHFQARAEARKQAQKSAAREAIERRLGLSQGQESAFFRAVGEALRSGDIWADDAAVMCVVLAQFAIGRGFDSTATLSGSGLDARLHVDFNAGHIIGAVDGQGSLDNAKTRLAFLAGEGWLSLEGRGPRRSIGLGRKLRDVLDAVPAGGAS